MNGVNRTVTASDPVELRRLPHREPERYRINCLPSSTLKFHTIFMYNYHAKLTRGAAALLALSLAACGGGIPGSGTSGPAPTYSIGGILTGLDTANSITLVNNGSDVLTLNGASNVGQTQTFAFATRLNYGASYSVAVSGVAPTSQPCTSTYGAGMLAYPDNVPGYYLPGVNVFCGQTGGANTFAQSTHLMYAARYNHTATLLPNGQVLDAGGNGGVAGTLQTAELYDPSGSWTPTGSMNVPRQNHTATLLPNGQVLVSGGQGTDSTSAELYATGTWTSTGSLNIPRYNHTATLLPNGKVLVSGGNSGTSPVASAELYDPVHGTWTITGSMNVPRQNHTATLLPNGKVLVSGGYNSGLAGGPQQSAELYDPVYGTWTYTGHLTDARQYHTATLLPNGKVLVAGGTGTAGILQSAELYDPVSGTWTYTCHLNDPRQYHTASLLPNGTVLVAGGSGTAGALSSAELYDPANCSGTTGLWTSTTNTMTDARYNHTATLLQSGKVLVSGGYNGTVTFNSAELYY
jgi:hypothetical protein